MLPVFAGTGNNWLEVNHYDNITRRSSSTAVNRDDQIVLAGGYAWYDPGIGIPGTTVRWVYLLVLGGAVAAVVFVSWAHLFASMKRISCGLSRMGSDLRVPIRHDVVWVLRSGYRRVDLGSRK